MISQRTRLSLVQLLAEQDQGGVATLLAKYGADMPYRGSFFAEGLRQAVQEMPGEQALSLAAEAVATRSALRHPQESRRQFMSPCQFEPMGEASVSQGLREPFADASFAGHRLRSWPGGVPRGTFDGINFQMSRLGPVVLTRRCT